MSALVEMVKKSKQTLGEKISCSLETLSPVHIGSGVRLVNGWDFIYDHNSKILKIVSQDELLPTLSAKQLNEFNNEQRRREILSKADSKRSYKLNYQKGEILEFERNGNGMPYIPGSSFKGAVRTALFVADYNVRKMHYNTILNAINANAKASAQWASTPLLEEAFGKDPNHNRMRMLVPSDIHFLPYAVEVSEVKILSLSNLEAISFNFKNFSLYPEHLKIGAKGNFTIRIDEFLFKNSQAKKELNFSSLALSDIAKIVNAQSKRHLESEIQFFEKCGKDSLKDVIEFNKALLAAIPTTDTEFILRLSWGSGWKGMTGDYLESNWLSVFRKKFNLGKRGFPIFPKTRRLLVVNGKPKFTFGWVRVRLNHSFSETDILSNAARKEATAIPAIPANPANIPNAPEAKGLVRAVIIDDQSKPPKVKILEGEHAEKETIMPGVNLAGLGLKKDSNVFVKIVLSHNRTRIEKVEYKQKA